MGGRFGFCRLDRAGLEGEFFRVERDFILGAAVAQEKFLDAVGQDPEEDREHEAPDEEDQEEVAVGEATIAAASRVARNENDVHPALLVIVSITAAAIVYPGAARSGCRERTDERDRCFLVVAVGHQLPSIAPGDQAAQQSIVERMPRLVSAERADQRMP